MRPHGRDATVSEPRVSRAADLRVRLLTALAIGPAFLLVMYVGDWLLALVMAAAGIRLYYEWDRMTRNWSLDPVFWFLMACGIAAIVLTQLERPTEGFALLVAAALTSFIIRRPAAVSAWNAFGLVYIGLASISFLVIDDRALGFAVLLWLATTVFATDIGAYAAGRFFGGPKLAPKISPKKTWAGFVGGLAGAVIWSLGIAAIFSFSVVPGAVLSALIVSAIGQMGDLLESWLKRRFNVKDTGQLLPGHGGLLDRVDSLIAAVICVAIASTVSPLFTPLTPS